MEEELNHGGGREPVSLPEADWVDAHERALARGSKEGVERSEQAVVAWNRDREPLEPLRQQPLIHSWAGGSFRHPRILPARVVWSKWLTEANEVC